MSRLTYANCCIVVFLLLQAADGCFTYTGLTAYGQSEGNPLVVSWISLVGPAAALCLWKGMAVGLGCVLHLHGRNGTVLFLSGVYLVPFVLWARLLFTSG